MTHNRNRLTVAPITPIATVVALAAMVALLTDRASVADTLVNRAIDLKPGEGTAQAVLALSLLHEGDQEAARNAAELAATFAPDDAEIAAIAELAGAEPAERPAPLTLLRGTPAEAALADCVANLVAGDLAASRATGPGWSLCHVAAILAK